MHTFDIIMLSILAAAVVAIIAIDVWAQKKNTGGMTPETANDIAMSVIARVALALVTEAERQYGAGTGELKMSACLAKLIAMLPASVVELVPKDDMQRSLEKALTVAKEKWASNPKLIGKEEDK